MGTTDVSSFSIWHWLIVLLIVLLIFGAKNLRNLVGEMKDAVRGFMDGMKSEEKVTHSHSRPPRDEVPNDNDRVASNLDHWYSVLDIKPSATPSAVRQAYRRKMQEYHPDKVVNLGIELRDLAEAKTKEINRAYEAIKRVKNW